jgi:hypothetical protein
MLCHEGDSEDSFLHYPEIAQNIEVNVIYVFGIFFNLSSNSG